MKKLLYSEINTTKWTKKKQSWFEVDESMIGNCARQEMGKIDCSLWEKTFIIIEMFALIWFNICKKNKIELLGKKD
jgi:hypothetical protein